MGGDYDGIEQMMIIESKSNSSSNLGINSTSDKHYGTATHQGVLSDQDLNTLSNKISPSKLAGKKLRIGNRKDYD